MKILNVQKRAIPTPTGDVDLVGVLAVGEASDAAAYLGIGDPDFVAARGVKMPLSETTIFWPNLEEALK